MKFSLKNLNFLSLTLSLILFASSAFAYLDPGTGSILLQGLIGGFAIIISFFSIYWQKVKSLFVKIEDEEESETDENIGNDDEPK